MVKALALTPWLLLFLSAQVGTAPIVIQPLLDHGAIALAVQSDNINADGQINVANTEVSLFGLLFMREDLERLQQYASDLQENAILHTVGVSEDHSTVIGLYSIIAKIVDGMDTTLEILHSASSAIWRLTPFSHRIMMSTPDIVESEINDQVLRDDARYSLDDHLENQFGSTANPQQLERLMTGFIRSHMSYIRLEETKEVAEAEDAPSGL